MNKTKQNKHILRFLASFVLVAVLIQSVCGCGFDTQLAGAASKKGISKSRVTLISGKTERIKLKGDKIKSVKCDKKKIAKVSKSGVITAKNIGKAKITVTGKSGKKYTCKVIVKAGLNFNNKSLKVGESFKLKLNGAKVKKITSSNKSVASVKKSGKVTALKVGSTTIKVVETKKKKYVCKVVVTDKNTKDNSNNSSVLNNRNASGSNTNINNNNSNNNNNTSSGNTPNKNEKEYTVNIVVDNCNNDYIETGDEKYVLSGSVDTTGQISSVSCTYKGTSEDKENISTVTGTAKWTTSGIPLKIGYNTVKLTVNMADGKKYDKTINVLRVSTSLKMSDDVVEYDIDNADTLQDVKIINEEILGTWSDGEEYNIAISNTNPLYKSIAEGRIKKNEIIYIPANKYNPYDVSLRYLYSDDKCSDAIEGYDSETCEVIHTYETTLFDIYEGDVAITADTIDKDNPIAFVYSPYGDDEPELSAMDFDVSITEKNSHMEVHEKGVQKENLRNFLNNGLDTAGLENGMLKIGGKMIVYDSDGNKDTTSDQVTLSFDYSTTNLVTEFRYIHDEDDFLPNEMTGGIACTDKVKAKLSWGTDIDLKDVVEKLNGGFDNSRKLGKSNWTIEGVDTSDTIFLGTLGIRLNKTSFSGFDNMQKEKLPVIGLSIILNLDGKIGIESNITLSYDQYRESGVSVRKESLKKCESVFKSNPTLERKKIIGLGNYVVEKYNVSAESADKLDKKPKAEITIDVKGEASLTLGVGAAIYIMCSGVIPAMLRVCVGPSIEGSVYATIGIRNSKFNKEGEVQIGNSEWYFDASGNAHLSGAVKLNSDIRVEVKAKREGVWNKEYDLKFDADILSENLLSVGISALNLKGHVFSKKIDENENEVLVPIKGATVLVNRNTIPILHDSTKKAVTNELGYYELQGMFCTADGISDNDKYSIEISAEGFSTYKDNAFELTDPSDLEESLDITLEVGSTKLIGLVTGLRKDKNTKEIISEPLEGAKVCLYDASGNFVKQVYTSENGVYKIEDISLGNYLLEFSADKYITTTKKIVIDNLDGVSDSTQIKAVEESDENGIVRGGLYDATNEELINSPLKMYIYKDYNRFDELVDSLEVTDGLYELELPAGNYTVVVKDEKLSPDYSDNTFYLEVVGGTEQTDKNTYLNPIFKAGALRAVLDWGNSPDDLDLHVVASGKNSYHLYWLEDYAEDEDTEEVLGELDIDETEADGPETITIYEMNDGIYHILVHDYTNRNESYSNSLALSGATVSLYIGDNENALKMYVPYKDGNLWDVCKYDSKTGKFTMINEMRYIDDTDDIE